jgi:hypothetical protein
MLGTRRCEWAPKTSLASPQELQQSHDCATALLNELVGRIVMSFLVAPDIDEKMG